MISLVIPVKDEEIEINKLLDSIRNQTVIPDEILIVDGGSQDNTKTIIRERAIEFPKLTIIEKEKAYPGEGRNIGADASSGDIIAFTDCGIIHNKEWLEELVKPLKEKKEVDTVFGAWELQKSGLFDEAVELVYLIRKEKHGDVYIRRPVAYSMALRKSVWEGIPHFPEFRSGEDRIFIDHVIHESGLKIEFTDKAIAYWKFSDGLLDTFLHYSEYAFHNLNSIRFKTWHIATYRFYWLLVFLFIVGSLAHKSAWILIPFFFFSRFIKRIRNKNLSEKKAKIRIVLLCVLIVLVFDLSLFYGTLSWLKKKYQS